jgi:hypothetical protein
VLYQCAGSYKFTTYRMKNTSAGATGEAAHLSKKCWFTYGARIPHDSASDKRNMARCSGMNYEGIF